MMMKSISHVQIPKLKNVKMITTPTNTITKLKPETNYQLTK